MSDVVIESVTLAKKPAMGQKLSLRAVISWPIEGEDTSITVNTKKHTGEVVHTQSSQATDQEMALEIPGILAPGKYFVEFVGTEPSQTEIFEVRRPGPGAGFIPAT